ncbi:MAG: hypothetical protein HRU22_15580 [Gammaproteobacteria bacterium]|nr:hypothetical protein [Gammaproteobacteria bacterium]
MDSATINRSVLYIAYHYPPILGSSGVHRTLAFTRYLSDNGWDTSVLTTSVKAYDNWSASQLDFIPQNTKVIRAFARNTAKDFSIAGKYWSWMALPDNWQSWIVGGLFSGLKAIKNRRPAIIISTYPIASAHIIAFLLHKITGIAWIADFRDPMAQDNYPTNPLKKTIFQWIEQKAVKHCRHIIVTAPGAQALYQQRFPNTPNDFWQLIGNGYDSVIFDQLVRGGNITGQKNERAKQSIILLHSGVIYPSERDPTHFFDALAQLKSKQLIDNSTLQVHLRASGHDSLLQPMIDELGINDLVKLLPPIPYKEALAEMFEVDALLLLQAANCNYQIPAKAYEYIRVQKPILGLLPPDGDTGLLLARAGGAIIAELDNLEQIKQAVLSFVNQVTTQKFSGLSREDIEQFSRQHQATIFEKLLIKTINSQTH